MIVCVMKFDANDDDDDNEDGAIIMNQKQNNDSVKEGKNIVVNDY